MAEEGVRIGLSSLGFSCHAPIPFNSNWTMLPQNMNQYLSEIEQAKVIHKNSLRIFCGLEVDYIPEFEAETQHFLRNTRLDYYIASVHFMGQMPSGNYWTIDGSEEEFADGFAHTFKGNSQQLVEQYYFRIRKMVNLLKPPVIGHFDKLKFHNLNHKYFNEQSLFYKNEITETLHTIKQSGSIVEVNTRGLYRHAYQLLYPSEEILAEMKLLEIPITLSSDAHRKEELTAGFNEALICLKAIGYKKISILGLNGWQEEPLF